MPKEIREEAFKNYITYITYITVGVFCAAGGAGVKMTSLLQI